MSLIPQGKAHQVPLGCLYIYNRIIQLLLYPFSALRTPSHPTTCVYVYVCLQVALANNETETQIEDKLAGLCDSLSFLGSSQAVVDCDKLSELPDVSFTIAGKEFGLTPEQYILKVSALAVSSCQQWIELLRCSMQLSIVADVGLQVVS